MEKEARNGHLSNIFKIVSVSHGDLVGWRSESIWKGYNQTRDSSLKRVISFTLSCTLRLVVGCKL